MIADGQEIAALRGGDSPFFYEFPAVSGPHGIAAEETGHKDIAAPVRQSQHRFQQRGRGGGEEADPSQGDDHF